VAQQMLNRDVQGIFEVTDIAISFAFNPLRTLYLLNISTPFEAQQRDKMMV